MSPDFPPIFLLSTHLQPDHLHRLEASIPSLTYDIHEAQVVLGNITRAQRARFELRRLKVVTEPVEGEGGSGSGSGSGSGNALATGSSAATADIPSPKRRKLSTSGASIGLPSHSGIDNIPRDVISVLKLAWFEDSLRQGRLLPMDSYMVYKGRRLPSVPEAGRHEAATTTKPPGSSPATTARDILRRAVGDQEASGNRPPTSHSPPHLHPPPRLVRQTTSEHDVPPPPIPDYLHTTYSCERPTPLISMNGPFIEELKDIRTLRLLQGDQIGVRAYSTSIATLAAYPYELQVPQEVERLPGCGAKIARLYGQWLETGQTKETADAASDPRLTSLKLFYDIWGVGDTTAREFYRKGWKDLDDIVEYDWASLSRVQQIGVKYYDEFLLKIPRQEVEAIAGVILTHAKRIDAGFEMTIVGGYRRGKKQSGDVDVVLSHRDEEKTLNAVEKVVLSLEKGRYITHTLSLWTRNSERGQLPLPWQGQAAARGGGFDTLDKAMVVWQDVARPEVEAREKASPHRRVDIIISPWKTVGCAVLGWSGGTTFQRDLRRYCKKERGLKFDSSGIRRRADGEWVDLESRPAAAGAASGLRGPAPDMETAEKRVFEGLGLVWRPPEERCTG
ncbi:DNA polymerase beta [Purpureocillium lavendulum]|uniref:DNA polymerase n=1 Tax=Purpureocillium lavendulum TaxID=1247861 RepID=A0AB34FXQ7_9HYPO|nr:DNA polymerase beta [Purpureocillium lavendulum]